MVLVGDVLEEAWQGLASSVDIRFLSEPRLFSIMVLVVIGFVGGRILGDLVRTLLKMTALDDMAVKLDIQVLLRKIGYRGMLSDFLGDLTNLMVYLITVTAVFYLFGFRFILGYSDILFSLFSKGLVAAFVILFGTRISQHVERIVVGLFRATRMTDDRNETEAEIPVYRIAGRITRYGGYLITMFLVLGVIGLAPDLLNMLVGIFGLAIAALLVLSTRDLTRNIAASIYLQLSKVFTGGETVEIDGAEGEIVSIRPLYTKVKDGHDTVYVPNTEIVSSIIRQKD